MPPRERRPAREGAPKRGSRVFYIESLGCAKNQVDSEMMIAALEAAGWTPASGPESAEVLIVNTCGFISDARRESIETSLELKARNPGTRVYMAGCLPQLHAEELARELPEIDGFVGAGDPAAIVSLVERSATARSAAAGSATAGSGRATATPHPATPRPPLDRRRLLSFPGSAYVKVAEGCDNRCTYCAIPLIRGPLASREPTDVVREIRGLLDRGAREIILIAQDLGSYGKDTGAGGLPDLLLKIAELPDRFQVRLLYIHPDHFPREILNLPRRDTRFLAYYDIPFQHASPGILRAMGRRGDPERNLDLLAEIRSRVNNPVIRSTFLVGFPGETAADFEELLRFQEKARLDWVGVFTYSREKGTPAHRMAGRVTGAVAAERKAALEERQVPITHAALDAWVGRSIDVLVEERIEGEELSLGRGCLQAPDVDGLVVLRGAHAPGTLVRARIFRRNGIDLEARVDA